MSDTISGGSSSGSDGFVMNTESQNRLESESTNFANLLDSNASNSEVKSSIMELISTVDADINDYGFGNQAGINQDTQSILKGAKSQLYSALNSLGNDDSKQSMTHLANTLQTAFGPADAPSTSAASSADVGQLMQQVLTTLQTMQTASGTPSGAGAARSSVANTAMPKAFVAPVVAPVVETPIAGPSVTGNVNDDLKTLESMIGGVNPDKSKIESFAFKVEAEADKQGKSTASAAAYNIGNSISWGWQVFNSQAAVGAINKALAGQDINYLPDAISAMRTSLQSGQQTGSVADEMKSLAQQAGLGGGNQELVSSLNKLSDGLRDGTLSDDQALAQFNALPTVQAIAPAGKGDGQVADVTGNVTNDVEKLMQMVAGTGTDGGKLIDFANKVSQEAASAGKSNIASTINNMVNSLSDGTYSQQGSLSALADTLTNSKTDSVSNNIKDIRLQMQTGQDKSSIANNLNALAREVGGNTSVGQAASSIAKGLSDGSLTMNQALDQFNASVPSHTSQSSSSANAQKAMNNAAMFQMMQMEMQMMSTMMGML